MTDIVRRRVQECGDLKTILPRVGDQVRIVRVYKEEAINKEALRVFGNVGRVSKIVSEPNFLRKKYFMVAVPTGFELLMFEDEIESITV